MPSNFQVIAALAVVTFLVFSVAVRQTERYMTQHNSFSDCYHFQNETGNAELAAYIQSAIDVIGNQPLGLIPGGCSGAGCPHTTPDDCLVFWWQIQQSPTF
jgi:hypothetical protein